MAQGDLTLFNEFSKDLLQGEHNLAASQDQIKVGLVSVLPAATDAAVWATFSGNEVSGAGYTAGGYVMTAASQAVTQVSGSTWKWDSSDNPNWSQNGSGPTDVVGAVIYNETATADEAIGFIDMTTDGGTTPISLQAGNISITWNASGILTLG
jgi:hypothetical protein